MVEHDSGTLILLTVALGAVALVAGILFDWRGALGRELPLWSFVRLQGVSRQALALLTGDRGLQLAEMRCAACASREECVRRLAAGSASPVADCPNAGLFAQPSGLANDSRSAGLKPAA